MRASNSSLLHDRFDIAHEPPAASPSARSRVVFIDLARAIALLMMIQGHTLDALLGSEYRTTTAFHVWTFSRGLTSCLFFFLAGFVLVMATYGRHDHRHNAGRVRLRRFGRFAVFLVIGYLLHWPVARIAQVGLVTADSWRAFLTVDALQCLAVTLAVLQLLALAARSRAQFLALTLIACVMVVVMTPVVWRADWEALLPAALAAYMTPHGGSLFPLFPWSAYGLLGAAAGAVYLHLGHTHAGRFPMRVLAAGGAAMLTAALVGSFVPWQPLGPTDFWSTSPQQFLLRAGLVCLGVALVARVSSRVSRLPAALNALAQESLLVYVMHLCLVYGSPWNRGLGSWYGQTLAFGPAAAWVLLLWMSALTFAYAWHSYKYREPRVAGWITQAAAVTLVGLLL